MKWNKSPLAKWIAVQVKNIKTVIKENSLIQYEVIFQNINRLYYIALIAIPVSVFNIFIFYCNKSIITENDVKWRIGIISSHVFIVVFMSFIATITYYFKKKSLYKKNLLITVTITTILLLGITITTIDQLVTPSVTPFLVACTITAAAFIMRPYFAAIVYSSAFGVYYYALAFTQNNDKILLSNRVNGITAVGIGFGLSIVLWNNKITQVKQRRYIELQQLDLVESNQRLSELNKMKDRLFTIITHDIREPMTTMVSLMELLEGDIDCLNSDNAKVIKAVKKQINHSYNMLDGLLDWCKHQSTGLTVYLRNWELYGIISDMLKMFKSKINAKEIEVINNVDEDIYIFIDRDLFELALRNIINNAIKFTKREGIITVSALKIEEKIIVKIQDNGIGISPSKMKNLFDEIVVTPSVGTEGEKGLGLGLHLSYEFIQRIDGQIWVESIVGKGSTFYISVPCKSEDN